jgi:hypothetical protein
MQEEAEIQGKVKIQNVKKSRNTKNSNKRRGRRRANRNNEAPLARRVIKTNGTRVSLNGGNSKRRVPNNMTARKETNLWNVVLPSTKQYLSAVTSPFSPQATGALRPDGFKERVVAATDFLNLTITPNYFAVDPTGVDTGNSPILGFICAFVPRCRKAGWNFGRTIHKQNNDVDYEAILADLPMYPVDENFTPIAYGDETDEPGDAYMLLITGLDKVGAPRIKIEDPDDPGLFKDAFGFYQMRFARFQNIATNLSSLRILGAGMQMNTKAAPINAGGFVYTGSAKQEEFYQQCLKSYRQLFDLTAWLQSFLEDQYRNKAISGMMARLPFDAEKVGIHFRDPWIENTTYVGTTENKEDDESPGDQIVNRKSQGKKLMKNSIINKKTKIMPKMERLHKDKLRRRVGAFDYTLDVTIIDETSDPASQDLHGVSSEIPIMLWTWEGPQIGNNNTNYYDISFYSKVHLEGIPNAICPFESECSKKDPTLDLVETEILGNVEAFPVAHSGNSFAQLARHMRKIAGAVQHGASKVERVLELLFK